MQKRVNLEEAFKDYLEQPNKLPKAPPRRHTSFMRDMTIKSLMQAPEEVITAHEDAKARATIFNTEISKVAREHNLPLSMLRKLALPYSAPDISAVYEAGKLRSALERSQAEERKIEKEQGDASTKIHTLSIYHAKTRYW